MCNWPKTAIFYQTRPLLTSKRQIYGRTSSNQGVDEKFAIYRLFRTTKQTNKLSILAKVTHIT